LADWQLNQNSTAVSPDGGVIAGLGRPKDGVASLAYDPAIHARVQQRQS
jgi:hypothetical protein